MLLNMILDMKNNFYNIIKITIPLLISVSFISYALKDFNYILFLNSLKNANYGYIIFAILLLIFIIFLRAVRWNFLFIKELDINSLYKSQLIGYMGNNIFPLRLGELLKAYYLEKKSKISKYEVLGTIILERVLDLVGLVLLFLILLNSSLFELIDPIYIKIIYSILIFTFVALLVSSRLNKVKNFKFKNKFFLILNDIISGFSNINSSNFLLSILFTLLIWIGYVIVVFLVQESMYLDLNFIQCVLILFLSSIVLMIPSMPGNIGTFEGAVVYTLLLFGIEDNFGFAFILHAVSFIPYTLLGLYYLIKERYILKDE
tara:strand:- start:1920 stop:2870 length:951 start_codon:yes stop_codon:yes gene_type:complete